MTLTDHQYKTLLDAQAALKSAAAACDGDIALNAARYGAMMAIERFLDRCAERKELDAVAPF